MYMNIPLYSALPIRNHVVPQHMRMNNFSMERHIHTRIHRNHTHTYTHTRANILCRYIQLCHFEIMPFFLSTYSYIRMHMNVYIPGQHTHAHKHKLVENAHTHIHKHKHVENTHTHTHTQIYSAAMSSFNNLKPCRSWIHMYQRI